jgi:class 3 adenylate cyclase/tetratricopeptide (TPR) repeat protein
MLSRSEVPVVWLRFKGGVFEGSDGDDTDDGRGNAASRRQGSMTTSYGTSVASFVPRIIERRIVSQAGPVAEPGEVTFQAGVLFADISGFTALTERLARAGPHGAEELTRLLNLYFGSIIDHVEMAGGDVLKFAGDALLAIWPASDDAQAMRTVVQRIADVTETLQARMHEYEVAPGVRLSMKLAIGAGEVKVEHLGGVFDRWEFLISGTPLAQLGRANDAAGPGDIVLAEEAAACLPSDWRTLELVAPGVLRLEPGSSLTTYTETTPPRPTLSDDETDQLLAFLPAAIRGRVAAGYADWLCELREVSVVFMNLPGFGVNTPLDEAQDTMRTLQAALYRYEGSINKMSVDDKGVSLIGVLGLPPLSHRDDPERAVRAAMDMQGALRELGLRSAVGVCTGLAFCGVVGNDRRREYTVMGDVVNLSARLMQAANGGVLVDESTARGASERVAFEALDPIAVKGKSGLIPVFVPRDQPVVDPELTRATVVLGRDAEREQLGRLIDAAIAGEATNRIGISAEPGLGKWALVSELIGRATQSGVDCLVVAGDSLDSVSPFRAFREPLRNALGLAADADFEALKSALAPDVRSAIGVGADISSGGLVGEQSLSLLAEVFGNDMVAGAPLVSLEGEKRRSATLDAVSELVGELMQRSPLLLTIKDWQLLDESSQMVAVHLMKSLPALPLVATMRSDSGRDGSPVPDWLNGEDAQHLRLGALTDDAIVQLACKRLGCDELDESLRSLLLYRSAGNPMYCEELLASFEASNSLIAQAGIASVTAQALADAHVPASLYALVAARVDRLSADAQMTLKVASVVGSPFAIELVAKLHPHSPHPKALSGEVQALVAAELIAPVELGSSAEFGRPPFYAFRKSVVRDIAYGLMLYSQRRGLHRRMAEWIETHMADELAGHFAALGRHWARSIDTGNVEPEAVRQATSRLQRAGDRAARSYANVEAASLYREALDALVTLPAGLERNERELALLLKLGAPLMATSSYADREVSEVYDRARSLGEVLGHHAPLFGAVRGLWQGAVGRSDYDRATALAGEMVKLAEQIGEPATLIEAHRAVGNSAFWPGSFDTARNAMERAATLMAQQPDAPLPEGFSQDPEIANRGLLAWTLASTGHAVSALVQIDEAVARGESLQHPFSMAYAHGAAMWTAFILRDTSLALEHANITSGISESAGIPYFLVAAKVVAGWAQACHGDRDAAGRIGEVLAGWRESSGGIGMALFLHAEAEALLAGGNHTAALTRLNDPLLTERLKVERWYLADVRRQLGECYWHQGKETEALRALRDARRIATEQGARIAALRIVCFEAQMRARPQDRAALDAALHALPERYAAGTVAAAVVLLGQGVSSPLAD